jgi:hypothetical protein
MRAKFQASDRQSRDGLQRNIKLQRLSRKSKRKTKRKIGGRRPVYPPKSAEIRP